MVLEGNIERNKQVGGIMEQLKIGVGGKETDPTVPEWAKQPEPPKLSELENDANFITEEDLENLDIKSSNILVQDTRPENPKEGTILLNTSKKLPPSNVDVAGIEVDLEIDGEKYVRLDAALAALANRNDSSSDTLTLIYDKTFEQVNSFTDTCDGLSSKYKKIIYQLVISGRTEATTVRSFILGNFTMLYYNQVNMNTAYPSYTFMGELEKHGNILLTRRYAGTSAASSNEAIHGMGSSIAFSFDNGRGTISKDSIGLVFNGDIEANVRLKIWGC